MSESLQEFLHAAEAWVCDEYSLDVRYIALPSGRGYEILSASISLNPLKANEDNSFSIDTGSLVAGQIQRFPVAREDVIQILNDASHGLMRVDGKQLHLPGNSPHSHYSDSANRDTWFSPLHLKTTGGTAAPQTRTQLHARDNELRASVPPFDGLTDLFAWLSLDATPLAGRPSSIDVRIGPPVDIMFDGCKLSGGRLRLVLHAHPSLDANRIGLAIRSVPGGGIAGRIQAATRLSWAAPADSRREAIADIDLPNSDSALVVLMVGSATVRRQWFIDPAKARNNRLLAVQHFDTDLRKVREAVLSTSESRRFEQGIASLLYVLGFSPVVQIETDSPDLIVSTPGGRLMLVECTLRIADFSEKIGKLVDRRGSLIKSLKSSGHFSQVVAVLVCRLPRDQIPAKDEELRSHGIVMVALEDIAGAFDRVRHAIDPDELIEAEIAKLSSSVT
jgi:hypothetical protein